MSESTSTRLSNVLSQIGASLVVLAPMLISLIADTKGDLTVKAQTALPVLGALGSVFAAWGWWTISLVRKDSKRERIKEAVSMGRKMCACTKTGEIMTLHHAVEHSIEVYCCSSCTRFNIVFPVGSVAIGDDTEFRPPLPENAHRAWLDQSRAGR